MQRQLLVNKFKAYWDLASIKKFLKANKIVVKSTVLLSSIVLSSP